MKSVSKILLIALALFPAGINAAPVATTSGSNLTAYHPNGGAANNNNWNNMTSPRNNAASGPAPVADFGNCNALIMRCAQPKCGSGCTDGSVAYGIVAGCVNSNATCKKHGEDLINYIVSQLVATSNSKVQQQQAAIAQQQNNEQMQAMQNQVAQTQQMLAAQTSAMNDLREQLSQQQQASAQAIADAAAAAASAATANIQSQQAATTVASPAATTADNSVNVNSDLTAAQRVAAEAGVDPDLLLRETISGEILSQIENAEQSLDKLAVTMKDIFKYAGCDDRGGNCKGPKRVTRFKEKAREFFIPYEDAVDQLYDALELAQSVGVDISNIYQYLNNSCNQWGKYMCSRPEYTTTDNDYKKVYVWPRYNSFNCQNGLSKVGGPICERGYRNNEDLCKKNILASTKGNHECMVGQTIPPEDDSSCTMVGLIYQKNGNVDEIERHFLYPEDGDMGDTVRVGCASSMLQNARIFSRKKQKSNMIDIEILQRIVEQDAVVTNNSIRSYNSGRYGRSLGPEERLKWCAISESDYAKLQRYASLKSLPSKNICINERKLNNAMNKSYVASSDSIIAVAREQCANNINAVWSENLLRCFCYNDKDEATESKCDLQKSMNWAIEAERVMCERQFLAHYEKDDLNLGSNYCDCTNKGKADPEDQALCEQKFTNHSGLGVAVNNHIETSTPAATTTSEDIKAEVNLMNTCRTMGGTWISDKKECQCDGKYMLATGAKKCYNGIIMDVPYDTSIKYNLNPNAGFGFGQNTNNMFGNFFSGGNN